MPRGVQAPASTPRKGRAPGGPPLPGAGLGLLEWAPQTLGSVCLLVAQPPPSPSGHLANVCQSLKSPLCAGRPFGSYAQAAPQVETALFGHRLDWMKPKQLHQQVT